VAKRNERGVKSTALAEGVLMSSCMNTMLGDGWGWCSGVEVGQAHSCAFFGLFLRFLLPPLL
jgi:hypothetical protein